MSRIPRWRAMTWVLIAWAVFGLVVATVYGSVHDCSGSEGAPFSACEESHRMGYGALFFLWFLGFTPLGIVWIATLVWRRPGRDGEPVAERPRPVRPNPVALLIFAVWLLLTVAIVDELRGPDVTIDYRNAILEKNRDATHEGLDGPEATKSPSKCIWREEQGPLSVKGSGECLPLR